MGWEIGGKWDDQPYDWEESSLGPWEKWEREMSGVTESWDTDHAIVGFVMLAGLVIVLTLTVCFLLVT